ncbi:DAZ-associated protein 2 isoform X1 [Daphnia magna]|uniref:DAZ-associated protein 2 isoform X1 n=1 Tax=Daphnia magna TaxID=35525 RepID=UPI0014029A99|nr:DAZ-associated protein 2 isoform X1 [Daphnia magna]
MPKKNDKKTGQPSAGYPAQPVMQSQLPYSLQPTAPSMANPNVLATASANPYNSYVPAMPGMPPPPPSYDQAMQHPAVPPNYSSHTSYIPAQHQPQYQPQYQAPMHPPSPYYPPQVQVQQVHPQATFVVQNAFDAGARFDSTSQVRIPPPPPGVAPNAAQVAQSTGHNVMLGQRKDRFFVGGSDGGATFW